jgi:hypothetical protein
MKRALTVALFSGLFVFAVPQGAFAHEEAQGGDCGSKTEKSADHSEQQAPEGRQGDRESHDDGTILF